MAHPVVDRAAEVDALITELHRIESPHTDYAPWWAKVRGLNDRLRSRGLPQVGTEELAQASQRARSRL